MSKVKVRCQSCGKWFQSGNAKDTICPECAQKLRKDKLAAKSVPPTPTGPSAGGMPTRSVPPPPKPKPPASDGPSSWIDTVSDVKIGQPDQETRPKIPSYPAPRENRGGDRQDRVYGGPDRGERQDRSYGSPDRGERQDRGYSGQDRGYGGGPRPQGGYRGPGSIYRENDRRTPPGYRVGGGMGLPDTDAPRPRQPFAPGTRRPPRPGPPGEGRPGRPFGGKPVGPRKSKRPPAPPRPKREKIPPPQPFKPTEEQIVQIEARYLELAVPKEFDGIRTQISKELNIPKAAVKKVVKELRDKMNLPSWWEVQAYTGTAEELEKIKALYDPHLPVPEIGIHKSIADQLSLKPGLVYQAIKQIRLDMNLPQFNDPQEHGEEFAETLKRKKEAKIARAEATAEASPAPETAEVAITPAASAVPEATAQSPAEAVPEPPRASETPAEPSGEQAEAQAEPAAESKTEPEAEQFPASVEIAERETDRTFEKTGDTTEIVPASTEQETDA